VASDERLSRKKINYKYSITFSQGFEFEIWLRESVFLIRKGINELLKWLREHLFELKSEPTNFEMVAGAGFEPTTFGL
jgi:hypothetical protein